ncbi:hypothetical protein B0H11DRAFT_1935755 [Mycena galericulata]|nr:hypothetical protein B0H11DRAFT_1941351 [Mycena galericulata]KAJ7437688.1 hypothetical protein B0H11DRAFT_1935755 [Mycena galericulata]
MKLQGDFRGLATKRVIGFLDRHRPATATVVATNFSPLFPPPLHSNGLTFAFTFADRGVPLPWSPYQSNQLQWNIGKVHPSIAGIQLRQGLPIGISSVFQKTLVYFERGVSSWGTRLSVSWRNWGGHETFQPKLNFSINGDAFADKENEIGRYIALYTPHAATTDGESEVCKGGETGLGATVVEVEDWWPLRNDLSLSAPSARTIHRIVTRPVPFGNPGTSNAMFSNRGFELQPRFSPISAISPLLLHARLRVIPADTCIPNSTVWKPGRSYGGLPASQCREPVAPARKHVQQTTAIRSWTTSSLIIASNWVQWTILQISRGSFESNNIGNKFQSLSTLGEPRTEKYVGHRTSLSI